MAWKPKLDAPATSQPLAETKQTSSGLQPKRSQASA
jgi:hypothetical protein